MQPKTTCNRLGAQPVIMKLYKSFGSYIPLGSLDERVHMICAHCEREILTVSTFEACISKGCDVCPIPPYQLGPRYLMKNPDEPVCWWCWNMHITCTSMEAILGEKVVK